MFDGFVQLPETEYLGFGVMMPWENNLEIQFGLWEDTEKIQRLKTLCGSEQAVGVFCYRCDAEKHTFSYHIACENKNNSSAAEFERLKINAGSFAAFKNTCCGYSERFSAYNELCDEIWGKWLPDSGYISLIELETFGCVEGFASLEIFSPDDPSVIPYQLKILLPVEKRPHI